MYNRLPLKLVGAAEKMEAATKRYHRDSVLIPVGIIEALSVFLQTWYRMPGMNECRSPSLIGNRYQIRVYKVLLRALARSRYRYYESVLGAGANCKKCDKQMTFVRVSLRCVPCVTQGYKDIQCSLNE